MKLTEIVRQLLGEYKLSGSIDNDPDVLGVTHNAQWVKDGYIFVAIQGLSFDGHSFVAEALKNGAIAVIGEGNSQIYEIPVPYIKVNNARETLAVISAMINDFPARKLKVVGVTGTKGKTTTSWLTKHILQVSGHNTGLLSTLGYQINDDPVMQFPAHFTTPEAPQIHAVLREAVIANCTNVVIESSSEALALKRLYGINFELGIWTNLTPEHLNFHNNMEGYFHAKSILIKNSHFSILNAQDEWAMRLKGRPHTTFGINEPNSNWSGFDIYEADGINFTVRCPEGVFPAKLRMIGKFNIANALASMAATYYLGVSINDILDGLESFSGVPGRMQIIQHSPFRVIVDFAHTPSSLQGALQAIRPTTTGKLIVVIGAAGGNRDPGKRAPLGFVASKYSDFTVFTEEDSRTTPVDDILKEMERGALETNKKNYVLLWNRYDAIQFAVSISKPGDTIIVCGKAGETTLERINEVIPWDEINIIKKLLDIN